MGEVTVAAGFANLVRERLHFALISPPPPEGNSLPGYSSFRNVREDKLADGIGSQYYVTRTVIYIQRSIRVAFFFLLKKPLNVSLNLVGAVVKQNGLCLRRMKMCLPVTVAEGVSA